MEKNQKKLHNLFFNLRKNSSTLKAISAFFLLSIFSFLLTFNREFYQIFFNQFNYMKHLFNKKAIFCFFNAILLFVAKESGLLASSIEQPIAARNPGQDLPEISQLLPTKKMAVEEKSHILLTKKIIVEEKQQLLLANTIAMEAKEVEKMKPALMEADGGSEEEEEVGIDELNKKFEDFIEKFWKERRMEAFQVPMGLNKAKDFSLFPAALQ